MFAIVEASGRQYQLEAGRFVDCDLVEGKEGDAFVFERVLMIVNGNESHIGTPFLDGAKVKGKILTHDRGRKIIVYKQRPKKGTRKKQGHRQQVTRILIDSIEFQDKVLAKAESTQKEKSKKISSQASTKPAQQTKAAAPSKQLKESASTKPAKPTTATPRKSTKAKDT